MKIYDELVARGLIAQVTNEEEIRKHERELENLRMQLDHLTTQN